MFETEHGSWHRCLRTILWILLGVLLAAALYTYFHYEAKRQCLTTYPLLDAELDCDEYKDAHAYLKALGKTLNETAEQYKKEGRVDRISVWVRELRTKQWTSYNEYEVYAPASLFKVPLMITYFYIAQIDPHILETSYTYEGTGGTRTDAQNLRPSENLKAGKAYTVEELIRRMIVESDNDAFALLTEKVNQESYVQVLIDLGLTIPQDQNTIDFVTVKTYANLYRTLYNASYLSREYSQKALDLLSQVELGGMRDPLPTGTIVAHKFGEREVDTPGQAPVYQFHDCGIIYKKGHHYSLCVMSEGKNLNDLMTAVKSISRLTYEGI